MKAAQLFALRRALFACGAAEKFVAARARVLACALRIATRPRASLGAHIGTAARMTHCVIDERSEEGGAWSVVHRAAVGGLGGVAVCGEPPSGSRARQRAVFALCCRVPSRCRVALRLNEKISCGARSRWAWSFALPSPSPQEARLEVSGFLPI